MSIPKYYIVELIEDVNSPWNDRIYGKGARAMVWQDDRINCYWVVNTNNNFKMNCAKKLYEFKGKELINEKAVFEECCSCHKEANEESLYILNNKYYCAECLLELLVKNNVIEKVETSRGKNYMFNDRFIGNTQCNTLDEIIENIMKELRIKRLK